MPETRRGSTWGLGGAQAPPKVAQAPQKFSDGIIFLELNIKKLNEAIQ